MDLKSFAKTYWSMQEKKLDPVGKEDGDVDNDGDKDSSDSYLMKRRAAIKKAMKKEEVEQEENDNYVEAYLDELKKTTMGSYIAKASKDLADRRFDQGDSEKRKYDPDEADEKEDKKLDKREQGIARAAKKITKEHHQKDADGKVIEHDDTTPSSVEELTVLEQLAENGRDIDAFEAVISYLIDEGFAKSWEEAQDIMITLKPELVEEVYQSQLQKLEESKTKAAVGGMLGNVGGRAIGAAIGGAVGGPAGAAAGKTIGKFAGAALGSAATAKPGRKKSAAIGAALGSGPNLGMGVGLGSGIGGAIGG